MSSGDELWAMAPTTSDAPPGIDATAEQGSFDYPRDTRDGWEPGAPTVRALLPSAIGGAVIPIAVYFLVRPHVGSDAPALAIAGVPAAVWVVTEWVRKRTLDPIGTIVLAGFVAGVSVAYALGGNAFVLKVRDSAFTFLFGIACLVSLVVARRPLLFYVGRGMSAGDDPERKRLFDTLWEFPSARAVFKIITVMWGIGLVCDAALRVVLAAVLPTHVFVVISPVVSAIFIGGMFVLTMRLTRVTRERSAAASSLDVPEGGGSTWWWARRLVAAGGASED
jgi:hypothetical protein